MSNDARRIIRDSLSRVKVIDVHTHLSPRQLGAGHIADIMLYHHVRSELVSATTGLEGSTIWLDEYLNDEQQTPLERVRRVVKYYRHIGNTTLGTFLQWILKDLYDFHDDVKEDNVEKIAGRIEEKGKDPRWVEEVLKQRCGIEGSITANAVKDKALPKGLFKGVALFPGNLVSGKGGTPATTLSSMERAYGRTIDTGHDFREYVEKVVQDLPLPAAEYTYYGIRLLPYLSHELTTNEDITRIIKKAKKGGYLSHIELGGFAYFCFRVILEELRKTDLRTIQVIVGSEEIPPHRSVTQWSGTFCPALARIANLHEDFHFSISTATDAYTQDFGILAKHIPNISVAGYWWHTLYPFYVRKALETRLDMVPVNKIVGFFSDAYHVEWCYPKLKMVKRVLEQILTERAENGWYSLDTCVTIINRIFHENPRQIYRI